MAALACLSQDFGMLLGNACNESVCPNDHFEVQGQFAV